jgi:hypothetical protein
MSNNFEFHRWKAHAGHDISVDLWEGMVNVEPVVRIVCNNCFESIEVWQYVEEYENEEA